MNRRNLNNLRRNNVFDRRRINDPNSTINIRRRANRVNRRFRNVIRQNNYSFNYRNINRRNNNNNNNNRPRFRKNFRRRRNQNNRSDNDNGNHDVEELTKKMGNLTLNTIPTTNLIVGNISYDPKYTAVSMYHNKQYYSILRNTPKCVMVPIYTKVTFTVDLNTNTYLVLYPYFCSFTSTAPSYFPNVLTGSSNVSANTSTNVVKFTSSALYPLVCGKSGISGSYRLVCSTIKVMNLTSQMNKSGQYVMYRLDGPDGNPCVYNNGHVPDKTTAAGYYAICAMLSSGNYSQLPTKNNFSALQEGFAHEFNLLTGTQIFSSATEYISASFSASNQSACGFDPITSTGINIKYLIQFDAPTQAQNYTVEMWQIFEVVPQPGGGLENIAKQQTYFIPQSQIEKIRSSPTICPY